MKLLVTGSRNCGPRALLTIIGGATIAQKLTGSLVQEILTGGAKGVDQMAAWVAKDHGLAYTEIQPDYKKGGKLAPLLRNTELVKKANVVVAVYAAGNWQKGGTRDTVKKAQKAGLLTIEIDEEHTREEITRPLF